MMLRQLVKITDAYPLTEADIALITTASSLHDIGKIRIPEEILNKPGRLTDEEFKIMKKHSELGAAIIIALQKILHTLDNRSMIESRGDYYVT